MHVVDLVCFNYSLTHNPPRSNHLSTAVGLTVSSRQTIQQRIALSSILCCLIQRATIAGPTLEGSTTDMSVVVAFGFIFLMIKHHDSLLCAPRREAMSHRERVQCI